MWAKEYVVSSGNVHQLQRARHPITISQVSLCQLLDRKKPSFCKSPEKGTNDHPLFPGGKAWSLESSTFIQFWQSNYKPKPYSASLFEGSPRLRTSVKTDICLLVLLPNYDIGNIRSFWFRCSFSQSLLKSSDWLPTFNSFFLIYITARDEEKKFILSSSLFKSILIWSLEILPCKWTITCWKIVLNNKILIS